tara:strand:- start:123 stop:1478 length:1356 start_codon:yes stop_codon:yes gene_type:complete
MIRNRRDDAHLVEPPFFATAEATIGSDGKQTGGGTVSFAKGKIFHCYNSSYDRQEEQLKAQNERKYFSKGADWHYPTNIDESFTYEAGDKFYLRPDKEEENSRIVKLEKESQIDLNEHILIWEAFEKGGEFGNTQFLSENVFLQNTQEFRQTAFTSHLLEEKQNGDKRYRMNGGFVCIFNKGITKFIPSFDYELKSGKEKYFYIKISVSITEKSEVLTLREADREYIKDFSVDKIEVIEEEERLDLLESTKKAGIGKACANGGEEVSESGEYFIQISDDLVDDKGGNININLEVKNVATVTMGGFGAKVGIRPEGGGQPAHVEEITFEAFTSQGDKILDFNTLCKFPEELLVVKRFQGFRRSDNDDLVQGTLDIVTKLIDRSGRGQYSPITKRIPKDFFISFSIQKGQAELDEDENYTECDKYFDHGQFPSFDITSRVNPLTSFIEVKNIT